MMYSMFNVDIDGCSMKRALTSHSMLGIEPEYTYTCHQNPEKCYVCTRACPI